MRKSTILFLLTSILIGSLLLSCGSNPIAKMPTVPIDNKTYKVNYFSNQDTDYVYKTNITIYGNELSGIFIAKKIDDATHRVVFTTEFGNKLLDFEISETDFKINAIVEELDRKILINILVDDFRLLLRNEFVIQQKYSESGNKILESKNGKRFNYLYVTNIDQKLIQIVQSTKRKEKIKITYTAENNIFAQSIVIQHYDIKLKIAFDYFKN